MPLSRETLEFLFENHLQDSKAWFDAHRDVYQRAVLEPMQELSDALAPEMLKIDPQFVTQAKVGKTISRLRRDTRFTHDPSLYRDHVWLLFRRQKQPGQEQPEIYVEVNQQGVAYGCGFYAASPAYMNVLREMILSGDPLFAAARRAYEGQRVFQLDGERYKRPRYPDQPEEIARWLELRGISLNARLHDFQLIFSPQLAQKLSADLLLLGPVYQFLWSAAMRLRQEDAGRASLQRNEEW